MYEGNLRVFQLGTSFAAEVFQELLTSFRKLSNPQILQDKSAKSDVAAKRFSASGVPVGNYSRARVVGFGRSAASRRELQLETTSMNCSRRQKVASLCAATLLLTSLAAPMFGQDSRAGSRAASALFARGSELVAAGSTEILEGGAELVVTSAKATAEGVRFVVEPVADATSAAAATSKAVTIEISQAAWEQAASALEASGEAALAGSLLVGEALEVVALTGSDLAAADVSVVAREASVLGLALVIGDVVIGLLPEAKLAAMLGHALHP